MVKSGRNVIRKANEENRTKSKYLTINEKKLRICNNFKIEDYDKKKMSVFKGLKFEASPRLCLRQR